MAGLFAPPRVHASRGEGERHATWLELFFDLVFVVAVAELGHGLAGNLTPAGLGTFAALFVPVWWLWIDFSYFADQFDTSEAAEQTVSFAVMLGVVVLALALPDVTTGGSAAFAGAYAALRVVIVALYVWVWRTVPEARDIAGRYALSFAVALGVWLVSLLVPEPARFWLWGVALLVEIGNGPVAYATARSTPQHESHMDERFGLFGIIVLGEAVVAVAAGVSGTDWDRTATLTAVAGFAIVPLLWRVYYTWADPEVISAALAGSRQDRVWSFVYGYGHLPIYAGATAAGIGIEAAIHGAAAHPAAHASLVLVDATPGAEAFGGAARAALAGGVAVFVLGAALVQWAAPRPTPRLVVAARVGAAAVCVMLAAFGGGVPAAGFAALVAGVLGVLVAFEARACRPRA